MIIAIANQKGGVGKSTTAQALAAQLAAARLRTLLIDLDPQTNTSITVGADMDAPSVFDVLMGRATAAEAIQSAPGATVIAGSTELYAMDTILSKTGKEYKLKEALTPISRNYDYIVLDTPPALGILTINALTAASGVIIPACAEAYGLQGIAHLSNSMDTVKQYTNRKLWVMGILLTRFRQTNIMRDMETLAAKVAADIGTVLYKSRIRESTNVKEAQALRQSIYDHAPHSMGAQDYADFAKEFLAQAKKGRK